jgi:hypothetical protein
MRAEHETMLEAADPPPGAGDASVEAAYQLNASVDSQPWLQTPSWQRRSTADATVLPVLLGQVWRA